MSVTSNHLGKPLSRAKKARVAKELANKGVTWAEIATALGTTPGYAYELTIDPNGDKARSRREARSRPCQDCGRPTSQAIYLRCSTCSGLRRQKWPKEAILAAIKSFANEKGKVPSAPDFAICDRSKYPTPRTVQTAFGSWSAAIEAAGFTPRNSGASKSALLVQEALLKHGIGLGIFDDEDDEQNKRR